MRQSSPLVSGSPNRRVHIPYMESSMAFPIKVCVVCSEEFELKPGKPGFANRCPSCSEEEADVKSGGDVLKTDREANAARREAMKNLLYRKDS